MHPNVLWIIIPILNIKGLFWGELRVSPNCQIPRIKGLAFSHSYVAWCHWALYDGNHYSLSRAPFHRKQIVFKKQLQNSTHIFYPQLVFSGEQGIRTASRSEKSRALYFINTITRHGLFRKVCFIFSADTSYCFCRTVTAKFDMGFSSSMFPRCFFLVLLLLIYCSSGAEVVTVDVHTAKDLIKSGYKYLDVRYVKGCSLLHIWFISSSNYWILWK